MRFEGVVADTRHRDQHRACEQHMYSDPENFAQARALAPQTLQKRNAYRNCESKRAAGHIEEGCNSAQRAQPPQGRPCLCPRQADEGGEGEENQKIKMRVETEQEILPAIRNRGDENGEQLEDRPQRRSERF